MRLIVPLVAALILGSMSPARAIDFGVLNQWRGVCAQSGGAAPGCGGNNRSSGSDWHGFVQDVHTASAINDSAARDLEYFASILGTLDDYSKTLLASELTDSERKSVNIAYQAVTQRFQNALALNRSLHAKIAALESEQARMQSRLFELESNKNTALAEIVNIKTGIAGLHSQIVRTKERLAWAEQDADVAKSLASTAALSARAARTSYWSLARAYFDQNHLGMPRDFIPEVEVASAYAERRRIVKSPSAAIPLALQTMPIAARAATVPMPVATQAAVPIPIDREAFLHLMGQWRTTLDNTHHVQIQAENLTSAAQESVRLIDQKAAQVADLQTPLDEERREENGLRMEAAALQVKLERTVASGQASLSEFFNSSKEMLVWQLAEESLKLGLSPIASAATRISMVGAIGRAYNTLFENDIPMFISLMGQNPPDDAIENFQSLMLLDSKHGRDILASTFFAGLSEMPEPNEAPKVDSLPKKPRLEVIKEIIKEDENPDKIIIKGWKLPSGLEFDVQERKPGSNPNNKNVFNFTRLTHAVSHTPWGIENYSDWKPFEKEIAKRMAKGREHSVIDVAPDELLDLMENLMHRVQTGHGVLSVTPGDHKGYEVFLIQVNSNIGRTGVDLTSANPKLTGIPTNKVNFVLSGNRRKFITWYAQ